MRIWMGWPHLPQAQQRVLVKLEKFENQLEGWFMAVEEGQKADGQCPADKQLIRLPMNQRVVAVIRRVCLSVTCHKCLLHTIAMTCDKTDILFF